MKSCEAAELLSCGTARTLKNKNCFWYNWDGFLCFWVPASRPIRAEPATLLVWLHTTLYTRPDQSAGPLLDRVQLTWVRSALHQYSTQSCGGVLALPLSSLPSTLLAPQEHSSSSSSESLLPVGVDPCLPHHVEVVTPVLL